MKEKIETKITLDQMADWYQKAIAYSIGDETSLKYSSLFKSQAQVKLFEGKAITGEQAYLDVYQEFYQNILGPLVVGWSVMALQTYKSLKQFDPLTQLWWLPRDSYPGMWAAEVLSPALDLDPKVNKAVHINRLNLGIKDEIDPSTGSLVEKTPNHYKQIISYIQQQIGNSKHIVVADSLQYAYMIDALKQGKKSFLLPKLVMLELYGKMGICLRLF